MLNSYSIYPYVLSIVPPLHVYLRNPGQVTAGDVIAAIAISLILTGVMLATLRRLVGSADKAGLIATNCILFFYCYGYIYHLTDGPVIMRHRYLFPAWGILFSGIVYLIVRSRFMYRAVHEYINIFALVLIVIMMGRVGLSAASPIANGTHVKGYDTSVHSPQADDHERLPNIVYIVVDGYLRPSETAHYYGYDNDGFNKYLRLNGFFVADRSVSNYPMTSLSLASSLNMSYPELTPDGDRDKAVRAVYDMIYHNSLMKVLKVHGYRIVNLSSGWGVTNSMPLADDNVKLGSMNEYAAVLLESTVLQPFVAKYVFRRDVRKRVDGAIDTIAAFVPDDTPTFLFAHIVSPHPPYVFDDKGREVASDSLAYGMNVWGLKSRYLNQYIYITNRLRWLIAEIVKGFGNNSVIVVQSDHGSFSTFASVNDPDWLQPNKDQLKECFSNLVAVRYPDGGHVDLVNDVTPVNIFRTVLERYGLGEYPTLHNDSFYTSDKMFPKMLNVTQTMKEINGVQTGQ